jgi:hypothetical protein
LTTSEHVVPHCLLAIIVASALCVAQDSTNAAGNTAPAQGATAANVVNCGRFAASDSQLDLISKLCVFALTYRQKLPDFIAQQTTTSKGPRSTVVITAQVTYRQGLEQHSQVTINGKPIPQRGRINVNLHLFTNGEFGPLLINLFEVPGAIEFAFLKTSTLQGVPVAVFDFHLPKDKNTFWAIRDPKGETLMPEFRGHLWLEAQTGQIVREEVEPLVDAWQTGINSMQLSADYSMIKVSDLGTYLLPVKSESTMCMGHLGANLGCTTNVAIFHDYQKFVATSRVVPAEAAP